MAELNLIICIFSFNAILFTLVGTFRNTLEKKVSFSSTFIRYGKVFSKELSIFHLPKSSFIHFYFYASCLTLSTMIFLTSAFVFDIEVPASVYQILDLSGGRMRSVQSSNASAILAFALFTAHCCRRFYESYFISVFRKKGGFHLSHYILAFLHYTACPLSILIHMPKFSHTANSHFLNWSDLSCIDFGAVILFVWVSFHQHKAVVVLANLRKDKKGNVTTEEYKLPRGGWFNYVTSPHMLAEILIYFALMIILWGNITWTVMSLWVLSNQIQLAAVAHQWYQEQFPSLSKKIKAIVPFVY